MPDESPEHISDDIKDILQQAILKGYPNPERRGCPGSEALREVAERSLPFQDALWEHVTHCSPCYREFLGFRRDVLSGRRRRVRRNRGLLVAALFAAIVSALVIWQIYSGPGPRPGMAVSVVAVDLRPFGPTRSETRPQAANGAVATLKRQPVQLQISLPVGSDEGTYQMRLMDGELRPLISGTAQTTVQDHVAKLTVTFDLSRIAPGSYVFGVHGPDGVWRTYPMAIR